MLCSCRNQRTFRPKKSAPSGNKVRPAFSLRATSSLITVNVRAFSWISRTYRVHAHSARSSLISFSEFNSIRFLLLRMSATLPSQQGLTAVLTALALSTSNIAAVLTNCLLRHTAVLSRVFLSFFLLPLNGLLSGFEIVRPFLAPYCF